MSEQHLQQSDTPVPGTSSQSGSTLKVKALLDGRENIYELSFAVNESTLGELKKKLYELSGVDERRQRLIYLGKVLVSEDSKLSDLGVIQGNTLLMVVRPKENLDNASNSSSQIQGETSSNTSATNQNILYQPSSRFSSRNRTVPQAGNSTDSTARTNPPSSSVYRTTPVSQLSILLLPERPSLTTSSLANQEARNARNASIRNARRALVRRNAEDFFGIFRNHIQSPVHGLIRQLHGQSLWQPTSQLIDHSDGDVTMDSATSVTGSVPTELNTLNTSNLSQTITPSPTFQNTRQPENISQDADQNPNPPENIQQPRLPNINATALGRALIDLSDVYSVSSETLRRVGMLLAGNQTNSVLDFANDENTNTNMGNSTSPSHANNIQVGNTPETHHNDIERDLIMRNDINVLLQLLPNIASSSQYILPMLNYSYNRSDDFLDGQVRYPFTPRNQFPRPSAVDSNYISATDRLRQNRTLAEPRFFSSFFRNSLPHNFDEEPPWRASRTNISRQNNQDFLAHPMGVFLSSRPEQPTQNRNSQQAQPETHPNSGNTTNIDIQNNRDSLSQQAQTQTNATPETNLNTTNQNNQQNTTNTSGSANTQTLDSTLEPPLTGLSRSNNNETRNIDIPRPTQATDSNQTESQQANQTQTPGNNDPNQSILNNIRHIFPQHLAGMFPLPPLLSIPQGGRNNSRTATYQGTRANLDSLNTNANNQQNNQSANNTTANPLPFHRYGPQTIEIHIDSIIGGQNPLGNTSDSNANTNDSRGNNTNPSTTSNNGGNSNQTNTTRIYDSVFNPASLLPPFLTSLLGNPSRNSRDQTQQSNSSGESSDYYDSEFVVDFLDINTIPREPNRLPSETNTFGSQLRENTRSINDAFLRELFMSSRQNNTSNQTNNNSSQIPTTTPENLRTSSQNPGMSEPSRNTSGNTNNTSRDENTNQAHGTGTTSSRVEEVDSDCENQETNDGNSAGGPGTPSDRLCPQKRSRST
ncbi:hypothetical protein BB558_002186 [Smittium angustum]|uniref:Ubiquitin-like domain-containing protein n=1 Tax=Smittium angustum TaxID=133377 RepID=A0A2U1J9B8_SMIAN|nr:hypothetical protein BB558_002186 [Smittium angustum]